MSLTGLQFLHRPIMHFKVIHNIYLKSEANLFFGMAGIRSVVVRKLELLDV